MNKTDCFLFILHPSSFIFIFAGIAKMVKAADCKSVKYRFESGYPLQVFHKRRKKNESRRTNEVSAQLGADVKAL
jgi:hypothetical protein